MGEGPRCSSSKSAATRSPAAAHIYGEILGRPATTTPTTSGRLVPMDPARPAASGRPCLTHVCADADRTTSMPTPPARRSAMCGTLAIKQAFRSHAHRIPVSSHETISRTRARRFRSDRDGHLLPCAGNMIISANLKPDARGSPVRPRLTSPTGPTDPGKLHSFPTSFGFGGVNAAIVLAVMSDSTCLVAGGWTPAQPRRVLRPAGAAGRSLRTCPFPRNKGCGNVINPNAGPVAGRFGGGAKIRALPHTRLMARSSSPRITSHHHSPASADHFHHPPQSPLTRLTRTRGHAGAGLWKANVHGFRV